MKPGGSLDCDSSGADERGEVGIIQAFQVVIRVMESVDSVMARKDLVMD